MDEGWRSSVDNRLGELKGALDGLRHSFTILAGAVGLLATIMALGFGFVGIQLNRLDGRIDQLGGRVDQLGGRVDQLGNRIDAIPQRLAEEFHAMRAEMAAQTSAIANAITATREAQPPAPPQIIVIPPVPQPGPASPKP
jgi:outer membrane murein-binding lipoprotein Lpp